MRVVAHKGGNTRQIREVRQVEVLSMTSWLGTLDDDRLADKLGLVSVVCLELAALDHQSQRDDSQEQAVQNCNYTAKGSNSAI